MARKLKNKKTRKQKGNVPVLGDDAETSNAGAREANDVASQQSARVWQPGVDNLEDGEELQFDPTAYDCLHAFHLGWPCLSFDIPRDALGMMRNDFPLSMFLVAGTQADSGPNNKIIVAKLSNVTGTRRGIKLVSPMEEDNGSDDDSGSSDDEEDNGVENQGHSSKVPLLQVKTVPHQGCVNRIRSMPQQSQIVASWSDKGYVQVWDMTDNVRALAAGNFRDTTQDSNGFKSQPLLQVFSGHADEGYAIDWSPTKHGRLATGDCNGSIHVWEPTTSGKWEVNTAPFRGHQASVEDIQWSPTEENVFASCSADKTWRIWDARTGNQPALTINAHDADVNVISWNRVASCMLASGCDDGSFKIWDLRAVQVSQIRRGGLLSKTLFEDQDLSVDSTGGSFVECCAMILPDSMTNPLVAHFKYHTAPVTSIEWSPYEASTLCVTCADNQLTVWDLSLERDHEEEAEYQSQIVRRQQAKAPTDLPPQLLFLHLGQKDIKEAHWHTQIQNLIISTAGDGFNVLRPSNLENLPAAATAE